MKSVFCQIYNHKKTESQNIKMIMALLLSVALCWKNLSGFFVYSNSIGASVQIFEGYIICGTNVPFFLGIILGNMIFISDAPFLSPISKYEMIRMGRNKWVVAQIMYIIISCFLFSIVILIFTIIICSISVKIDLSNSWSYVIQMLNESPTYAINRFKYAYSFPEFVYSIKPLGALVQTIVFNSFYMSTIGLVILSVNLISPHNYGWVVASAIHLGAYICYANMNYTMAPKYSLLCYASPAYHYGGNFGISSGGSFFIFTIFSYILIRICLKYAPNIELFD